MIGFRRKLIAGLCLFLELFCSQVHIVMKFKSDFSVTSLDIYISLHWFNKYLVHIYLKPNQLGFVKE